MDLPLRDGGRLHEPEKSSVGQNGDERGGQGGVINVGTDEAPVQRNLSQDEGKFADLREANADAKCCLC